MSGVSRLRTIRRIAATAIGATTTWALLAGSASAGTPPPPATFGPNVHADNSAVNNGANEPQVTVDQAGTSYVTWQTNEGASKTKDGVHFTSLGDPDAAGPGETGDVMFAHTAYSDLTHDIAVGSAGSNAVFWGDIGPSCANNSAPLNIRVGATQDAATWTRQAGAGCQPAQVDRPWLAAYTPPAYRGTDQAENHTSLYVEFHDFGASNIWVETSTDGGQTWGATGNPAIQAGSVAQQTSTCNTTPGGIAVDQNGSHKGRIYATWLTSDLPSNAGTGCNYTEAQAFDHLFISYSDNGGATWISKTVFNDPCAPNPPTPPNPTSNNCQDMQEIFAPVAVDDAGNVYVAYVYRDVSKAHPQYDVDVATSTDGGNVFTPHRVDSDTGTHYFPWIAAAGNGGVDVVYYDTPYVEGTGMFGKPAAAPATALWTVQMSQSVDAGGSWTQSPVSHHTIYFGDVCTTGIFCGLAPAAFNWGNDRILLDNFGVAVGPDGGARVAWTDTSDSFGTCPPAGTITCQQQEIQFACQTGGVGLTGQALTGCGTTLGSNIPDSAWAPALLLGGTAALGTTWVVVRRRRRINDPLELQG